MCNSGLYNIAMFVTVENTTKIGHDLYEYIDEKETKMDYIHTYLKVRSRQLKHCQNNIQFSLEHFGISYN